MLKALILIAVLLGVGLIEGKVLSNPPKHHQKGTLRFNSEGKFKIVNFADLHYGEFPGTDRGRAQDGNSSKVMTDILGFENPDFVVFTGDFITGDAILLNSTGFIDTLLQPVVQGNYRWASTYGNHDNGITTTRDDIFNTEAKYESLCYTQHSSSDLVGVTNYFLPIYSADDNSIIPILILWFFDSRGGFDPNGFYPDNVDPTVVNWFIETNDYITRQWGKIPALAFFHIPTIDYEDVQADIPNRPDCVGLVDEPVVPQNRDTLFMKSLLESGNVLTTFVGHDHGNGWCCKYENFGNSLEICYNRHTGYGGYGQWTRGARVIELDANLDMWTQRKNHIRLENGTIIDEYPSQGAT